MNGIFILILHDGIVRRAGITLVGPAAFRAWPGARPTAILFAVDEQLQNARAVLEQISRYRMPFGRFGPKHYPPKGVPIYDLPAEYLAWFALNGFPKGKLGELLQIVYQTKADGCDAIFDPIRRAAGGRYNLRPT